MKKREGDQEYRVVYSTESGKHCATCGQPEKKCTCAATKQSKILGDGTIRVKREKSGRGGKTVSVIYGLPLTAQELAALGTALKKVCGCGGSVKDGTIEIQGDQVERLVSELNQRGYSAKRGGG